jgi:putative hemolysin/phosphoserine phosphatase
VKPEQRLYTVTLDCAQIAAATPTAASGDPLPSWNDGPTKTAILKFVADVTHEGGESYVPPKERIAVTDNDGTLWTEQPIPAQAAFVFARVLQMAPEHPDWATTPPYQYVLQKDAKALASLGEEDIAKLVATTHAGMTEDAFMVIAKTFLQNARHPRFNVRYTETVYQPMLELLALLRANGFSTYIVSGGGAQFMRAFAEEVYGIPPENVIGSSLQYELQLTPEGGSVLVRLPEMVAFNDKGMKPANIQRHIGRRPILAIGNSDGDLAMFQYTGGANRPYLNLLVVHDDAEREYNILTNTDAVMTAAAQSPWLFVSMKKDFKTVFPSAKAATEQGEAAAPGEQASIANPASQNCVKQGGKVSIETRPDGGQFGVCLFEDNLQCEEWALLRGECPTGGVKVTGYATAAARFCAISGGQYAVTGDSGTDKEQGTCTLKSGTQCDAAAFFAGTCQ